MNTFHMKIVIFAYLVLIPVIVNSASFNCDKAHTRIETLICGDSDLSILDGLLASNYKTYLKISMDKTKPAVKKEQRSWLKKVRENKCDSVYQCITTYADRIKSIKKHLETTLFLNEVKSISNTNQLIWLTSFRNLQSDFFTGHRSSLVTERNGLTSSEFNDLMGGPPEAYIRTDDFIIAMACRHHSCMEKGIVAIDKKSGELIFGGLHFFDNNGNLNIYKPRLTFFYKNKELLDKVKTLMTETIKEKAKVSIVSEIKIP